MNALKIKCALMEYFRYTRQWICVDEASCGRGDRADILVDTGKEVREVEVKISSYDLNTLEKMKIKHLERFKGRKDTPNKFSICVPSNLIEEAKKWVKKMDSRYGLIEYVGDRYNPIRNIKTAKQLHSNYSTLRKKAIYMRLCSSLIGYMRRSLSQ